MTATPFTATVLGYPRIGPEPGAQARHRGLLGRPRRPRRAARPPPRRCAATPGSSWRPPAWTRSRSTPSPTTTRCSTPPSCSARCPPPRCRRHRRPDLDRYFADGPRHRRRRAAGDDQVVRHQLPLPGPGARPGHRVRAATRPSRSPSSQRPARSAFAARPVLVGPVTFLLLGKAADDAPPGSTARPARRAAGRLRRAAAAAGRGRASSGCSSTSPPWSPTSPPATLAALAERAYDRARRVAEPARAARRHLLRRARRRAAGAGRARRSRRSASTWSPARATWPLAAAAGELAGQDRWSPASSTAATSGATDLERCAGAPSATLLGLAGDGGRVDVVLAAARPVLDLDAETGLDAAAAPLAGVRPPEGRRGRHAGPRRWPSGRDAVAGELAAIQRRARRPARPIRGCTTTRSVRRACDARRRPDAAPRPAPYERPRAGAAGRGCTCRRCRPPRSARSRRPASSARPAPRCAPGELDAAEYDAPDAGRDRRVIALQERARPRRAGARRARAQRHGAVLRRAARRLRRHRSTAGSSPTAPAACARRSSYGDVSRPAPMTVRLDHVRAVADRQAGQGHADRPGHHPGVVVRPRRPAARRDRPPGRAGPPRRDRRPARRPGSRSSRSTSRRCASCCRCARPTRPAYLAWAVDAFRLATSGVARRHPDPHPPVLLGVRRDHRRDRRPRRRRDLDRGRPLAHGGRSTTWTRPASPRASARASTTSTRRGCPAPSEIAESLRAALKSVPAERLWVNPDCGLKTRTTDEVTASLADTWSRRPPRCGPRPS